MQFVEDPAYASATVVDLVEVAADFGESFFFVADADAVESSEHPLLVVDLVMQRGRTFRVIPSWVWAVESNLSTGSEDFDDFVALVDADGVFRGSDGIRPT